jgi:hypothetical protein
MANLDAFTAQIVEMVRNMSDEAILSLVRGQLGSLGGGLALPAARRGPGRPRGTASAPAPARRGAGVARSARGGRRRSTVTSAARTELLDKVEKLVRGSSGLSSSQVAKAAGVPQPRAAAALKELKLAKRIFQGGDRRFARYAGDAKSASAASQHARTTASGPVVKGSKRGAKRGKRRG